MSRPTTLQTHRQLRWDLWFRCRALPQRSNTAQPGQVLIMVGVMMFVLVGFVAIATNTGLVWMNRRALQNSVDAAALAGVQQLPEDSGLAIEYGCEYATDDSKNRVNDMYGKLGSCAAEADVEIKTTYYANDTITVTAYKEIRPLFGLAFGFANIEIGATATAIVGSIGSACGVPLFQTQGLLEQGGVWGGSGIILNKPTIMKTSDSASGNFLALQWDGSSSAADFRYALGSPDACANPETAPSYEGSATTNPGNMAGPINQGMANRRAAWEAQGNCLSKDPTVYLQSDGQLRNGGVLLTPSTCYRMVVIPILDANLSSLSGSKSYPIKGFAIFYIANWCGNSSDPRVRSGTCTDPALPLAGGTMQNAELWGYYVGFLATSDKYTSYNGYGTKVFALVD